MTSAIGGVARLVLLVGAVMIVSGMIMFIVTLVTRRKCITLLLLCLGGQSHGAYGSLFVYVCVCLSAGFLVAR